MNGIVLLAFAILLVTQTTAPPQADPTPSAQPAASTPARKVGNVLPPRVLYQVEPQFTKLARKKRIHGVTLVALIIDAQGNPTNVHVKRSMADTMDKKYRDAALSLDQAAVDAVSKYRFAPATEDGKPVPVELNIEVNFQLF